MRRSVLILLIVGGTLRPLAADAQGLNGALVGTKQAGSLLTRSVMGSGGVGDDGPEVCTNCPVQSTAAVAAVPAAPGGKRLPAFSAILTALLPLKSHCVLSHSSNMSATPLAPGS